jgi:hypothetical protein
MGTKTSSFRGGSDGAPRSDDGPSSFGISGSVKVTRGRETRLTRPSLVIGG